MKEYRFAAVISHPIQHYSPLFRELNKVEGLRVKVFYACDHGIRESFDPGFGATFSWDVPLLDGYEYEFLRQGYSPKKFGFWGVDAQELARKLDEFDPGAVWIHGYGQRICWRALLWARGRARVLYFGDSELLHHRTQTSRIAKRLYLPWFFSRCDAFITIGDNNEAYYRHYGVPHSKMLRGACPVDIERFWTVADSATPEKRKQVRARHNIPEDAFVVLMSGKLEPHKRPLDLVEALAKANASLGPESSVLSLFIGSGPLRRAIEQKAEALGLKDQVRVTGFVNQAEMPELMLAGDALAVTSERDAHPLVVTEALPFGLPVVISDRVGCVGPTDTARPGENALVYPCGAIQALADSITRLAADSDLRERMGAASRGVAATQDLLVTVQTVLEATGWFEQDSEVGNDEIFEPATG